MNQPAVNPYLRTKVMTASPEELRLMLYDGAIKFCRQAKVALDAQRIEDTYNHVTRAQRIVLELSSSLKHSVEPELCGKLSALYTYIYRLLIDANTNHESKPIDEALRLLEFERETWRMLMSKLVEEAGGRPTPGPRPGAPMPTANPFAAATTPTTTYSRSA
jgi:flagellar protein FliS